MWASLILLLQEMAHKCRCCPKYIDHPSRWGMTPPSDQQLSTRANSAINVFYSTACIKLTEINPRFPNPANCLDIECKNKNLRRSGVNCRSGSMASRHAPSAGQIFGTPHRDAGSHHLPYKIQSLVDIEVTVTMSMWVGWRSKFALFVFLYLVLSSEKKGGNVGCIGEPGQINNQRLRSLP